MLTKLASADLEPIFKKCCPGSDQDWLKHSQLAQLTPFQLMSHALTFFLSKSFFAGEGTSKQRVEGVTTIACALSLSHVASVGAS